MSSGPVFSQYFNRVLAVFSAGICGHEGVQGRPRAAKGRMAAKRVRIAFRF